MCDQGLSPPGRVESESDIGEIYCLVDEAPKDLPRRNPNLVIPAVVPADVHEPDAAALLAARNRKYTNKTITVEMLAFLIAGDLPPVLSVRRRLNEPRLQMATARIVICEDWIVGWHNPLLIEIITRAIVPRMRNILPKVAII
jgi:hypothetical protein